MHSKLRPPIGVRCRLTVGASTTLAPLLSASRPSARADLLDEVRIERRPERRPARERRRRRTLPVRAAHPRRPVAAPQRRHPRQLDGVPRVAARQQRHLLLQRERAEHRPRCRSSPCPTLCLTATTPSTAGASAGRRLADRPCSCRATTVVPTLTARQEPVVLGPCRIVSDDSPPRPQADHRADRLVPARHVPGRTRRHRQGARRTGRPRPTIKPTASPRQSAEAELRAATWRVAGEHGAVVGVDDRLDDRQAEPGARLAALVDGAEEAVEDVRPDRPRRCPDRGRARSPCSPGC